MPFGIWFQTEDVSGSTLGNAARTGEIVLGTDRESFTSLVGFWSPADYAAQWRRGLERVIQQQLPSCLITSIHDPSEADVIHWWLLYPDGEEVAVQNALLLPRTLDRPFSTVDPYASVPARRVVNDDGYAVSEWHVPVAEVRDFLASLSG